MRITSLFALLPLIAATSSLRGRQEGPSALDDPCTSACDDQAEQQMASTGCGEDGACLCQNQTYLQSIYACLAKECPADKVEAMKAEFQETCAAIIAIGEDDDESSSSISSGLSSISSAVASRSVSASSAVRSSASATPTSSGALASLSSVASSASGAVSSVRNSASSDAASASSSAWAVPTAAAGIMGVVLAAVGAVAAV
ncbi:uncharacterized protein MKK02DRAFT_39599 [Dioszegia hungarica]|uniref:CFEM domain-containing protein n=1 Tax=Dioszegia hungarica TaxID=4972 RepID=A0AA38LYM2_9TREE|nr:uncharacterized protein MKK02DRAFT_39599 [Dioszegia hungarica]KAI9639301.1 hypothetical protein MKK02DRAFT_39599 [Dioszegia hungarica]